MRGARRARPGQCRVARRRRRTTTYAATRRRAGRSAMGRPCVAASSPRTRATSATTLSSTTVAGWSRNEEVDRDRGPGPESSAARRSRRPDDGGVGPGVSALGGSGLGGTGSGGTGSGDAGLEGTGLAGTGLVGTGLAGTGLAVGGIGSVMVSLVRGRRARRWPTCRPRDGRLRVRGPRRTARTRASPRRRTRGRSRCASRHRTVRATTCRCGCGC